MQSYPTLSRELVELFDNVRKQADEYVDIFNILRRKSRDIDSLRMEMQQYLQAFKSESSEEIIKHRELIERSLIDLAYKVSFVEEVYKELEAIHQLRDSLQELRISYHNRTVELDTVIHSIRSYLRKETEQAFLHQEKKIALKIQGVEAQLVSFDTRLFNTQDIHRREFMAVSDEVNRFKNKITETKFIVDEATKIINETIELAEKSLNEKLRKYSTDIETKIKTTLDSLHSESTLKTKIDKLRAELSAHERKTVALDQKYNVKTTIAIGACIVAVIISFLAMFAR